MFRLVAALIPFFLALGTFERSAAADPPASGLRPGEQVEPWNPIHVTGPDRGTNLCPLCTYLEKPVVVVFARDTTNTAELATRLEPIARKHRAAGLRVVVAVVDIGPDRAKVLAADLKVADISLCYLTPKSVSIATKKRAKSATRSGPPEWLPAECFRLKQEADCESCEAAPVPGAA